MLETTHQNLKIKRNNMKLPIQAQPVLRKVGTAKIDDGMPGVRASSRWNCYLFFGTQADYQGSVDTPWSDEVGAGVWACNNWISDCGNDPGGCEALPG